MGVPKFPKLRLSLRLSQLWSPITLCADLWLRWSLKQSCIPCQDLFNDMSFGTCTQQNRVNSRLLVVKSQSANLTIDPFFGHNLCCKCPNGSCELILDIYVLIIFQWYKKILNPLGFDPCTHSLNIRESTKTPTPKVEAPLGVWRFIPSHFLSLPGFLSWPVILQALTLVVSPRLGLRQYMNYLITIF
jgi:hypothetical protein